LGGLGWVWDRAAMENDHDDPVAGPGEQWDAEVIVFLCRPVHFWAKILLLLTFSHSLPC